LASAFNYVEKRVKLVERTGWQSINDNHVFVLPDKIIGEVGDEHVKLKSKGHDGYASAGSLEDWQREVAKPAGAHKLLALHISASLAGPCLEILNMDSCMVHFYGDSSLGKTTAMCVAATVWGKGSTKDGSCSGTRPPMLWRAGRNL
jgi:putative DNA primase/helicase